MGRTTKGRVIIPLNLEEQLDLATKVYQKHLSDGNTSILNNLDGLDWAKLGPEIANCLKIHEEAEDYKRKMEESYRNRDIIFSQLTQIVRASKSLLKASYSKNPKKLGDWGFVVDDTPKSKRIKAGAKEN